MNAINRYTPNNPDCTVEFYKHDTWANYFFSIIAKQLQKILENEFEYDKRLHPPPVPKLLLIIALMLRSIALLFWNATHLKLRFRSEWRQINRRKTASGIITTKSNGRTK